MVWRVITLAPNFGLIKDFFLITPLINTSLTRQGGNYLQKNFEYQLLHELYVNEGQPH